MIVYYSEYSMFVVGDYVPKWLPKWASQLKTIMSDLRLRNGNFPFQNRKGCELGLYKTIVYYFDQTQGVNDSLSGLYTSLLPNSEVCALTFLCFLTSLVIFYQTCNTWRSYF